MGATASAATRLPGAAGPRGGRWRERLPALALVAVLGYLVVVPLALLVVASFSPTGLPLDPGWSIDNYLRVYRDPGFYRLALTTLEFALGCMVATLIVGGTLAWLVERTDLPAKRLCRIMIVVPMVLPPFLLAMGWVLLASPRTGLLTGLLQSALGLREGPFNIYSLGGMVFVETLALVPSTFLILSPAFRNMDPALEEAAMTSGANLAQTIRRIFVPLLTPAILAAATYLLMVGFLVFDVPGTLGMPVGIFVMSSRILYLATDQAGGVSAYSQIAAIAMSFLVLLLGLAWLYRRMTRAAGRFVTVTGKGFRPRQRKLGRAKPLAIAFVAVYFALAVLLPLAVLGWTSLMPYLTPVSLDSARLVTLANHRAALESARVLQATWNSIWVSMLAATLTCALALSVSWVVHRTQVRGRGAIDALAFMPIAIPGVMIGMALVYVYLTLTFVPVYGTPWILVIAFTTVYLSFASRTTNGALIQLHRDLEDAARVCGAGPLVLLRRIVVPLMLPALAAVWIWVVAHVVRELSTALLLQGEDNPMLAVLLWSYWSGGEPTKAAAVGAWLIFLMTIATIAWQLAGRRAHGGRVA